MCAASVRLLTARARRGKGVLCAGLYANVAVVRRPETRYAETEHGAIARDAAAREMRLFTRSGERVFVHPASVNFQEAQYESPFVVFHEKVQTTKAFLRDTTVVSAYALLLFGGNIGVDHEGATITVDDWLRFRAPARIAVLIRELRRALDAVLERKIANPDLDIANSPVLRVIAELLESDGL